jgi:hypothetical protein
LLLPCANPFGRPNRSKSLIGFSFIILLVDSS